MKKTYTINDLVWVTIAVLVCIGGLDLGFGSFRAPQAGFMPFMAGLMLGVLSLLDLLSGWKGQWKKLKDDKEIWLGINWGNVILTMALLFAYVFLTPFLGFVIATFLLLLILFQLMDRRPWWVITIASLGTSGFFYFVFQIGLEGQLPKGFLGF